ncbi:MAG: 5-formyltetrahydrofolate cyclo-ligase [Plesiomonas sp.]|uniref:5-formyltetrahydrofolate cyclo-ligase n=1 Tax=Plesiomonas sp. TaxID=2486279 RepID=UPI003F3752F1
MNTLSLSSKQQPPSQQQRQHLRQQIRTQRQQLSPAQQHIAAETLALKALKHPFFRDAQQIALYLAVDGELNTLPLIHALWQCNKQVYLPVLHPFSAGNLLFLAYRPNTNMTLNRYNIAEPRLDVRDLIPASALDLICTPLVAFDDHGHRLGMGGGFYDRTLAAFMPTKMAVSPPKIPQIIGLAHDCQRVNAVPQEAWDIPLQAILTPQQQWFW